jgi:hypothetical protein
VFAIYAILTLLVDVSGWTGGDIDVWRVASMISSRAATMSKREGDGP